MGGACHAAEHLGYSQHDFDFLTIIMT